MHASQLHRLIGELDPFGDAGLHQCPERQEDDESGVQRRLGLRFEHPRGPSEPPAADRLVPTAEGLIREEHRHTGGVARSARVVVAGECALEGVRGFVGTSRPPRSRAQQLQFVRPKAAVTIGRAEHLHGLRPGMAVDGVATELECLDHRGTHPLVSAALGVRLSIR